MFKYSLLHRESKHNTSVICVCVCVFVLCALCVNLVRSISHVQFAITNKRTAFTLLILFFILGSQAKFSLTHTNTTLEVIVVLPEHFLLCLSIFFLHSFGVFFWHTTEQRKRNKASCRHNKLNRVTIGYTHKYLWFVYVQYSYR